MRDGEIIAASEEERFTLAKHARAELPRGAIHYCLREAGIDIKQVDYICSPLKTYPHYDRRIAEYIAFHFGFSPKVELYEHHICHAASTYYGAGFGEATVLCLDNSGDSSAGMVIHAKDHELKVLSRFRRHNSLGLYYGMMTQYLGYQMTNDEYKVMGLASFGKPTYLDRFERILRPSGLGFEFDTRLDKRLRDGEIYTSDFSMRQERVFADTLEELLGPRRLPGAPMEERFVDIAASMQKQLEVVVLHLVKEAVRATGCPDVCLAGGVALNCKANMEVLLDPGVRRLYVPPVPHDAGVALGAAMLKCAENGVRIAPMDHAYWGPSYGAEAIHKVLTQVNAGFVEQADPVESAVRDLLEGRTVGWFHGRMEFGPRALGNRSILADPRSRSVKDRINATIKYREEYRPFCPSVLYEHQKSFFSHAVELPFMNITLPATQEGLKAAPAVIHVDQTARIQSVRDETNPLYHRLITRFGKETGVPILLNTSLNINEQPMVNAPLEALRTFFCSGLDVLYLGPFRLSKPT